MFSLSQKLRLSLGPRATRVVTDAVRMSRQLSTRVSPVASLSSSKTPVMAALPSLPASRFVSTSSLVPGRYPMSLSSLVPVMSPYGSMARQHRFFSSEAPKVNGEVAAPGLFKRASAWANEAKEVHTLAEVSFVIVQ